MEGAALPGVRLVSKEEEEEVEEQELPQVLGDVCLELKLVDVVVDEEQRPAEVLPAVYNVDAEIVMALIWAEK